MPKRFKFRISRIIPSFQSCRSKDHSSLPSTPVPTFRRLTSLSHKFPDAFATPPPPPPPPQQLPPSRPPHSSIKRRLAASVGCGGLRSRRSTTSSSSVAQRKESSSDFKWRKEDKWHVIAKIHDDAPRHKIYSSAASGVSDDDDDDDDDDDVVIPPLPPTFLTDIQKRRSSGSRKKKTTVRLRLSTSSGDSGLFSSEGREGRENDGEETETLVSSSRSFSTDSSSEYNPHLETIREGPSGIKRGGKKKLKKRRVARKRSSSSRSSVSSAGESLNVTPARLSVFQRLIPCTVEGKVRESFAVVKRTEDPYEDFRRSMMEMILEKQMFEERDLEQMLHCFLSLNSRHHHEVIVGAFTEIWEALFCKSPGGTDRRDSDVI